MLPLMVSMVMMVSMVIVVIMVKCNNHCEYSMCSLRVSTVDSPTVDRSSNPGSGRREREGSNQLNPQRRHLNERKQIKQSI